MGCLYLYNLQRGKFLVREVEVNNAPLVPTSDFARSLLSPNSLIWFSIRFLGARFRLISNQIEEDDNNAHFSTDEFEPSIDI